MSGEELQTAALCLEASSSEFSRQAAGFDLNRQRKLKREL